MFDVLAPLASPEFELSVQTAASDDVQAAHEDLSQQAVCIVQRKKKTHTVQSLMGKCGRGRWGDLPSRSYLAYHMRSLRALQKHNLLLESFEEVFASVQAIGRIR